MANETADLFRDHAVKPARHVYTVSEITRDIKATLSNTFGEVWIEGEVSNFNAHTSGHFYFSLKDKDALLSCVMFSRANREVKFKIEDGLKVIGFGKIEAYIPRSLYQLIVEKIEPKGIGSLQLALEQLKQKLEAEGLFKAEHKKPIPYLPSRIGVVTSLSGAAIKDILKVLDRRFAGAHIIINPASVQGEQAKEEIVSAIRDFNLLNESLPSSEKIEVMIVGRGGGSMEDLWTFNEEAVARAIYSSKIPVISAVGHERDWTIADLVSDLRAATPSVAAELVIPEKDDLKEKVQGLVAGLNTSLQEAVKNNKETIGALTRRLSLAIEHTVELDKNRFAAITNKLSLLNPVVLIEQHMARTLDYARQIYVRAGHLLRLRQAGFNTLAEKLSSLSPLNILSRGYSITFKMPEGAVLKESKSVKKGETLKTRLHRGEIISQVMEVK